jgi:putative Ca2+/H+ antiporter (TMEM165/GDT1 family)
MLELGTFALFNVLGFGTMAYGTQSTLPMAKPLAILSLISFLVLSFWMLQPDDVGMTNSEEWTDGISTWNKNYTEVWITDEFTNYLQWIYFGLALLAFLVFSSRVIF